MLYYTGRDSDLHDRDGNYYVYSPYYKNETQLAGSQNFQSQIVAKFKTPEEADRACAAINLAWRREAPTMFTKFARDIIDAMTVPV